jgi:hypothetical protein
LKHSEAIGSRENNVEEDEIGLILPEYIEPFVPITGLENVIKRLEHHLERGADSGVVIDQQDSFPNDRAFHEALLVF